MSVWMRAEGTIGHAADIELFLTNPEELATQRGSDQRGSGWAAHRGNSQLKSGGYRRGDCRTHGMGAAE